MNILIYAGSLAATQAGAAHATLDFANALAATTPHRVFLYATEVERGTLNEAVHLIPYTPPRRYGGSFRMRHLTEVRLHLDQLRRRTFPDVDLCYTQGLVWGLAFRRFRPAIPIISHTGAVIAERERIEEHGGAHCPWWVRADAKLLTRLERRSYREPHWAHVVSTKLVAEQRADFFDVDPGLFNVCPYGLSLQKFSRETTNGNVRKALDIPSAATVLLTVCRLTKWKNIDAVIRAFANLGDGNHYLVVAGDGEERPRLESLTRELGIESRVRFTGHVSNPAPYYAAADVFALPSQIESFGIVYGEAMLMGLPCIGLRNAPPHVLSSAEDVIVDGETGLCVSDEQELQKRLPDLMVNAKMRRTMGEAGLVRARTYYSCDAYVSSILALARSRLALDC